MKRNLIEIIHHINAVLIIVFCVFYPSSYHNFCGRLFSAVISLIFLYFFTVIRSPHFSKELVGSGKKLSLLESWFFAAFFLGLHLNSSALVYASGILLAGCVMLALYYLRRFARRRSAYRKSANESPP
jgi:uncharacterized membrane protein